MYKPTRGERPLWDFPDRTLGRREVATYAVSETAGWGVVPPTVWRPDGPLGAGMAQAWVEPGPGAARPGDPRLVDVVPPESVPAGWRSILDARGDQGQHVVLAHAEDPTCCGWRCSTPSSTTPTAKAVTCCAVVRRGTPRTGYTASTTG